MKKYKVIKEFTIDDDDHKLKPIPIGSIFIRDAKTDFYYCEALKQHIYEKC